MLSEANDSQNSSIWKYPRNYITYSVGHKILTVKPMSVCFVVRIFIDNTNTNTANLFDDVVSIVRLHRKKIIPNIVRGSPRIQFQLYYVIMILHELTHAKLCILKSYGMLAFVFFGER